MRGLLAITLTTLLLTACTQNTNDQTSNTLAPPTTETTTTPTTQPTTTTTKEPTLEDKLLTFHSEQMHRTVDTSEPGGWEQFLGWYHENSTDPLLSRVDENYTKLSGQGRNLVGPGPLSNVVGVEWHSSGGSPASATVSDCVLGRVAEYNADGSVAGERAGTFILIDYVYVYEPDTERFLLSDVVPDDRALCDPVDLLKDGNSVVSSKPEAEAVLAVHHKFLAALGEIDQRSEGYGSTFAAIDELTTSTAHELLLDYTQSNEANGWFIDGGGYESNVVGVRVEQTRAAIVDCSRILFSFYDAEGNAATTPDDFFELRETYLIKEDGLWRVEYYWQDGNQECDPSRL